MPTLRSPVPKNRQPQKYNFGLPPGYFAGPRPRWNLGTSNPAVRDTPQHGLPRIWLKPRTRLRSCSGLDGVMDSVKSRPANHAKRREWEGKCLLSIFRRGRRKPHPRRVCSPEESGLILGICGQPAVSLIRRALACFCWGGGSPQTRSPSSLHPPIFPFSSVRFHPTDQSGN